MHILSLRPPTLNTGRTSRLRRAEQALRAAGVPTSVPLDCLRATNQASASVCTVNGVAVLVSYVTVAAVRDRSGAVYAVPVDYYSATTERSVLTFARGARIVRCASPESLHQTLVNLLA